jgi:hypothetical protein
MIETVKCKCVSLHQERQEPTYRAFLKYDYCDMRWAKGEIVRLVKKEHFRAKFDSKGSTKTAVLLDIFTPE